MADAPRDNNYIPTLLGVSNSDGTTPVVLWADPTTHRLLVGFPYTIVDGELATRVNGTTYTITNAPATGTEPAVFVDGARQNLGAANDYTRSGVTFTFNKTLIDDQVVLVDSRY